MADDRAELAMAGGGHIAEEHQKDIARNRAELDAFLNQPVGRQAAADAALIRELGGAA